MKLFITGGCGFIGSNFVRFVLNNFTDVDIINYDLLTYAANPLPDFSHSYNLSDIEKNNNYKFVRGDICNEILLDKHMKDVDFVVHFAAESHVDNALKNNDVFLNSNTIGTKKLLEAALKNNVKRFHFVSTDEVYGSIEKGYFKEDAQLKPSNIYSVSKAAGELLCQAFWKTYNLPFTITRGANNFGPYQFPEKVIPLFITNLLDGKKVPLYGDGLHRRDWIFVEDHCRAIWHVLKNGKTGESYNVTANNELANIELTKLLLEKTDRDESFIEHVTDRPGHDRRYAMNAEKLNELGWRPSYSFSEALDNTVNWYKNNVSWWKRLKNTK